MSTTRVRTVAAKELFFTSTCGLFVERIVSIALKLLFVAASIVSVVGHRQERRRNSEQFDWLDRPQIWTASTPGRLWPCGALVTATASTMAIRTTNKALTGGVLAFMLTSIAIENVNSVGPFRLGRPVRRVAVRCVRGATQGTGRRSGQMPAGPDRASATCPEPARGSGRLLNRPGRKGGLGGAERALSA